MTETNPKPHILPNEKLEEDNFYYRESALMTSTGSWYIDFENKKSYWDDITRTILEYPLDFVPSLKMGMSLYAEEHHAFIANTFFECALSGIPFDTEILMLTANKRKFWARAIGKPIYNDAKKIIGVRGIFQDIDDNIQKEINLEKASGIVASQNNRLFNFAHIVSHNLRSHSSNLTLIVQLINDLDTVEEKLELLDNITHVSESLNTTIEHLNEVVSIQTSSNQLKEQVSFNNTLDQVTTSINQIILNNNVTINSDFSRAEFIEYIPAYLDSIFLNLLTNAIKYKHKDRDPVINISTSLDYTNKDRIVLKISDNGSGIDMDKFGDKVFGMYKTFHYNADARGIGLFITKNQIESLNGEIQVKSDLSSGTTFTIKF
ncbi:PAS domain-containing sensor histidine kinase [uncultured Winogradskyella sp.]|uniref:sensor histidine kinase n=1 Tax=uncultured Winogradskyella sp. TaxID=395353 RepID=UPI00262B9DE8|nr:PAS domain-containing sensor histidine kinase [uncultured Winogradskyella sp.]|tara:strand:+ start:1394 stop:2521 length:1128 start_codon:yes stop_codon:yes gene_type:complete